MKLISLKCENLFSYKTLSINFKKQKSGLILIEGVNNDNPSSSNGSGKTSIFECINWCLFDDTIKKYSQIDELIRKGQESGYAQITIQHDKKNIIVEKIRSIGKTTIKITVDGTDLKVKNPTAGKQFIESLLGVDFSVWKNSIVLGQNSANIFLEGTSGDRIEMFGNILNFELYDKCLSYLRKTVLKELESRELTTSATLNDYTETLENLSRDIREFGDTNLVKIHSLIKDKTKQKEDLEQSIKRIEQVKELEQKIGLLAGKYVNLLDNEESQKEYFLKATELVSNEIKMIQEEIKQKEQTESKIKSLETLTPEIEKLEKDILEESNKLALVKNKIFTIEQAIKQYDFKIKNIEKLNETECESCGNLITEECVDKFKVNKKDLEIQLVIATEEKAQIVGTGKSIRGKLEDLKEKYAPLSELKQKLNNILQSEKRIQENKLKLKSIEQKHESQLATLRSQQKVILDDKKRLESERSKLSFKEDPKSFITQYKSLSDEILSLSKKATTLEVKLTQKNKIEAKVKDWKSELEEINKEIIKNKKLELFFGKYIKSALVNRIINKVENKINNFLSYVEKCDSRISITMAEKCDIAYFRDGEKIELSLLSGGEKKMLSILFSLAFSDIVLEQGKVFDFMVFDEATDNLDTGNSTIFIDLLQDIVVQNKRKFFIITHSEYIKNILEPIVVDKIIVKKNNGVSEVEA